jgi:putative Mg2+ transporter-C (MgtC) family protein
MPELSSTELIIRVALAAALGGLLGFERELSDQPAGFRTHILVSLGAALFTLAGAYGLQSFAAGSSGRAAIDPTRVAAQVVTGIGFLGAGAIIRRGVNVRGLTTAASLWVTAAIGLAVGLDYIDGAIVVTVVALIVLYGLRLFKRFALVRLRRGRVKFFVEARPALRIGELTEMVDDMGAEVEALSVSDEVGDGYLFVLIARLPNGLPAEYVANRLRGSPAVGEVSVEL